MNDITATDWIGRVLSAPRSPDFNRLLTVLRREQPDRPALFEFHMNNRIFEDAILPVESAWQRWGDRIAMMGGVDIDLLSRAETTAIHRRACALLETTHCRGYALGSGNSVPDFIPDESYCALLAAAMDVRF